MERTVPSLTRARKCRDFASDNKAALCSRGRPMSSPILLKSKIGVNGVGAGVWNIGPGNDPFGGPTRDPIPMLDRLPLLAEAGMSYYEAHDVEITAQMAPDAAKLAKKLGLKCAMYTPSFFAAPIFKD